MGETAVLWERLRAHRRDTAQAQGVPPYVIFGDATLREMLAYRPRDHEELARLSGVGLVKLERYGEGFLTVLRAYEAEHGRPADLPTAPQSSRPPPRDHDRDQDLGLSTTELETLTLFRAGSQVPEIALARGLRESTIYTHLARCIAQGELTLEAAVPIGADELVTIQSAFKHLEPESLRSVKPVFEALEGRYDYGLLRCVRAALDVRTESPLTRAGY